MLSMHLALPEYNYFRLRSNLNDLGKVHVIAVEGGKVTEGRLARGCTLFRQGGRLTAG